MAAPFSGQSEALAERDFDAIHPEVEFERRSNFDAAELEERDAADEEMHLALRDLVETYNDLMERDANGEFTDVERRWNWKGAVSCSLS